MRYILSLCLTAFVAVAMAQESVLLRLDYKVGDLYVLKMSMDQNIGNGMMNMSMDFEMPYSIKDVTSDNLFIAEMGFSKVAMDMSQAGVDVKYDSTVKEEDMDATALQMHQSMSPILETVVQVKMNDLGESLDMKIVKGVADASQFSDQVQSVAYPEKPVTTGDTWSANRSANGMDITSTYKVKSIDKNFVYVDVSGEIKGKAEGTLTGALKIDRKTGTPLDNVINMDMNVMGQTAKSTITIIMEKQ